MIEFMDTTSTIFANKQKASVGREDPVLLRKAADETGSVVSSLWLELIGTERRRYTEHGEDARSTETLDWLSVLDPSGFFEDLGIF
jgi:hypothetical protein